MLLYPQVQWPKCITNPLCYRIYLKQHLRALVPFQKLEDLSLVREHADSENTSDKATKNTSYESKPQLYQRPERIATGKHRVFKFRKCLLLKVINRNLGKQNDIC